MKPLLYTTALYSSRSRGYLCVVPITGHPPISEKLTDHFTGLFHILISISYLGSFSHLTPYLGNITVTPIPVLYFFFFSSGSANYYVYVFYHYLRAPP